MTSREEVAKKLREAWDCNGGFSMTSDTAIYQISKVVCAQGKTYEFLFNRLADLIDPTCEGVEEREDDGIDAPPRYTSHCGNCGQMWDETSGIPRFPMYCPNCGARVVRGRLNPWVVKD